MENCHGRYRVRLPVIRQLQKFVNVLEPLNSKLLGSLFKASMSILFRVGCTRLGFPVGMVFKRDDGIVINCTFWTFRGKKDLSKFKFPHRQQKVFTPMVGILL